MDTGVLFKLFPVARDEARDAAPGFDARELEPARAGFDDTAVGLMDDRNRRVRVRDIRREQVPASGRARWPNLRHQLSSYRTAPLKLGALWVQDQ